MIGTDAHTGKPLSGDAHLRQSIRDILTTPVGSRVMRRTYGSRLFELIDAPVNRQTIADICSAVADALGRWEPRIKLDGVHVRSVENGAIMFDLSGTVTTDGTRFEMAGVQV